MRYSRDYLTSIFAFDGSLGDVDHIAVEPSIFYKVLKSFSNVGVMLPKEDILVEILLKGYNLDIIFKHNETYSFSLETLEHGIDAVTSGKEIELDEKIIEKIFTRTIF